MTLCGKVAKQIAKEYPKEGARMVALFEDEPHEFKSEADQRNLVKLCTRLLYPKFEKKIGFTGNKV